LTRSVATITGAILGTWVVLAGSAWWAFGADPGASGLAAAVNWLPGMVTIGLIHWTRKARPTVVTAVALAASFIRLIFAVVGGVLGWYLIPCLRGHALELVIWGGVFYVIALVVETTLALRSVTTQRGS